MEKKVKTTASIYESHDYSLFKPHKMNRQVHTDRKGFKDLIESMVKYGFPASEAIHVVRGEDGSLLIKKGHHRFEAAKQVGLPIKFTIERQNIPIHDLEIPGAGKWKPKDFFESYVKQGIPEYLEIQAYVDRTGISLPNAITMFYGYSAGNGSSNQDGRVERGNLKIKDRKHPQLVAYLVESLKELGIPWANENLSVKALSRLVRVPEFNPTRLIKKAKNFTAIAKKQVNLQDFLQMYEDLYNYKANKSNPKVPLVFLATKEAKTRNISTPKGAGNG